MRHERGMVRPDGAKVRRLRKLHLMTQEDLARESGYDTRTIQRLERGKQTRPITLRDVAAALDVSLEELIVEEQDGDRVSDGSLHALRGSNIPSKPYYAGIVPHEKVLDAAMKWLSGAEPLSALLLWGMGGLGKSTLAAQASRRALEEHAVADVFWVHMGRATLDPPTSDSGFHEVAVDMLLAQLGRGEMLHEAAPAKATAVAEATELHQSLLVLDDLAAAASTADEVRTLLELGRPRGTLLTCRADLAMSGGESLRIPSLSVDDGIRFVRRDAQRRGITSVLPRRKAQLGEVCEATGGVPFAMQLALGQATRVPWNEVMKRLAGEQDDLYYYLFRDLWCDLDNVAQKVLVYMRTSPDSVDLSELLAAEDIATPDQITGAVDRLVRLALLDVLQISDDSATYGIHPLTRNFIVSDLPRLWEEEDGRSETRHP